MTNFLLDPKPFAHRHECRRRERREKSELEIRLPREKAIRLAKHLLVEHPITRGKITVNDAKIKRKGGEK